MLDVNASSEQGGNPAAPRVHQRSQDRRHEDGAPVSTPTTPYEEGFDAVVGKDGVLTVPQTSSPGTAYALVRMYA
jgi:hypothetical protein